MLDWDKMNHDATELIARLQPISNPTNNEYQNAVDIAKITVSMAAENLGATYPDQDEFIRLLAVVSALSWSAGCEFAHRPKPT